MLKNTNQIRHAPLPAVARFSRSLRFVSSEFWWLVVARACWHVNCKGTAPKNQPRVRQKREPTNRTTWRLFPPTPGWLSPCDRRPCVERLGDETSPRVD